MKLKVKVTHSDYWSTLQVDSLLAEPQGKPKNTRVGRLSLLQVIFPTQELKQVSCIAGRFFTNWAIREVLIQEILDHQKGKKKNRKSKNMG